MEKKKLNIEIREVAVDAISNLRIGVGGDGGDGGGSSEYANQVTNGGYIASNDVPTHSGNSTVAAAGLTGAAVGATTSGGNPGITVASGLVAAAGSCIACHGPSGSNSGNTGPCGPCG